MVGKTSEFGADEAMAWDLRHGLQYGGAGYALRGKLPYQVRPPGSMDGFLIRHPT